MAVSDSLYEDGKTLKGTGTRASKSRLATFYGAERQSSPRPSDVRRKEDKKIPLASFPRKKSSEIGEGGLWMDPSSFSIEFQQGKRMGFADLWWTVSGAGTEGGEEDQGQLHERGRFKYAFDAGRFRPGCWLAGRAAV